MELRFIERDGKKILQYHETGVVTGDGKKGWVDVPLVQEEKSFAEKLYDVYKPNFKVSDGINAVAKEAIRLVIEELENVGYTTLGGNQFIGKSRIISALNDMVK